MKTCRTCLFIEKHSNIYFCTRRKKEGIVVQIDPKFIDSPCSAREPERYNEKHESDPKYKNDIDTSTDRGMNEPDTYGLEYYEKGVKFVADGKKDRRFNKWEIKNEKEECKEINYITSYWGGDMADFIKTIKNVKIKDE